MQATIASLSDGAALMLASLKDSANSLF